VLSNARRKTQALSNKNQPETGNLEFDTFIIPLLHRLDFLTEKILLDESKKQYKRQHSIRTISQNLANNWLIASMNCSSIDAQHDTCNRRPDKPLSYRRYQAESWPIPQREPLLPSVLLNIQKCTPSHSILRNRSGLKYAPDRQRLDAEPMQNHGNIGIAIGPFHALALS
jgi:hypothetical protein